MITDGKKWYYLAVKSLSPLFKGIASNHVGNFYCLNCFHSFRIENKFKTHKNVCKNHDYCYVEMPKEDNETLKYNHGEKNLKVLLAIYADMESLHKKTSISYNNRKNSSKNKIRKHTPSG